MISKVENDDKVWDLYANGCTIGINQVEQNGSRHKCMKYKPHNISELSAFVAAIRPGFKSMYNRFENREDFSWGIPVLDNMLRTEQLPVSFLFFQEQVMAVLNYAGFPMDECYGIIKAIAKKHPEKVKPLKAQFIKGFKKQLIEKEKLTEETAQDNAEKVWQIVNDNCGYSFNSSHAYCVALDSLYQAWQKANYPYEFYEVLLQHFADKGKKDKVNKLKAEMKKYFHIQEGDYNFRNDHRKFVADKDRHVIYPALVSIKGIGQNVADDLYSLHDKQYESFIDLLYDIQNTSIKKNQLDMMIKLNMFSEFGYIEELLIQRDIFQKYYKAKQISLSTCELPRYLIEKHAQKITAKIAKSFDNYNLMKDLIQVTPIPKKSLVNKLRYEFEYLGYITTIIPDMNEDYHFVLELGGYNNNIAMLYRICDGYQYRIKVKCKYQTIEEGDMIRIIETKWEKKWRKIDDRWTRIDEEEEILKNFAKVT